MHLGRGANAYGLLVKVARTGTYAYPYPLPTSCHIWIRNLLTAYLSYNRDKVRAVVISAML